MSKFKPKKNQNYFMINSRWEVKQAPYTDSKKANERIAIGNCFETEIEAKEFVLKIKAIRKGEVVFPTRDLSTLQKYKLILFGKV